MAGPVGGFAGNDPYFQNLIGGALGSAWGGMPGGNQLMPGPVSNLSNMLIGDMNRGGLPGLGAAFPVPTFVPPVGTPGNPFTPQFGIPAWGTQTAGPTTGTPPFIQGIQGGGFWNFGDIPGGWSWNYNPTPGQIPIGGPVSFQA